jgi:hypothetical protein
MIAMQGLIFVLKLLLLVMSPERFYHPAKWFTKLFIFFACLYPPQGGTEKSGLQHAKKTNQKKPVTCPPVAKSCAPRSCRVFKNSSAYADSDSSNSFFGSFCGARLRDNGEEQGNCVAKKSPFKGDIIGFNFVERSYFTWPLGMLSALLPGPYSNYKEGWT